MGLCMRMRACYIRGACLIDLTLSQVMRTFCLLAGRCGNASRYVVSCAEHGSMIPFRASFLFCTLAHSSGLTYLCGVFAMQHVTERAMQRARAAEHFPSILDARSPWPLAPALRALLCWDRMPLGAPQPAPDDISSSSSSTIDLGQPIDESV